MDKLKMHSPDLTTANIDELAELDPRTASAYGGGNFNYLTVGFAIPSH